MNTPSNQSQSAPPISLRRIAVVVIILVVLGLIVGLVPRFFSHRRLMAEAHEDSTVTVSVIAPGQSKAAWGTPLPAEVQAFIQASLHSRASGYLKSWFVDIGSQVTNGQILAEIDSPELDQQYAQVKAELDQAKAAMELSKTTADRWTELLKTSSVSDQETAEKKADYTLKQANVEAAQANLNRLEDLKAFKYITAPFTGVITARNTDIGQLIAAGGGPELFRMAQTDPLRVYVKVPQQYVYAIKPEQKAELIFQELPGKNYEAKVTRTSGAIDPVSRTLQVELQVANPKNELFAGGYAQVRFDDAVAMGVLTISDNALIFRAEGLQVAVVNKDSKVELRTVKLGRDSGKTVEVLSGLNADDRVVDNPPDSIAEGMLVKVAVPKTNNSAGSKTNVVAAK